MCISLVINTFRPLFTGTNINYARRTRSRDTIMKFSVSSTHSCFFFKVDILLFFHYCLYLPSYSIPTQFSCYNLVFYFSFIACVLQSPIQHFLTFLILYVTFYFPVFLLLYAGQDPNTFRALQLVCGI